MLRSLERALAHVADEVRGAGTVTEACEQIVTFVPDVLLLDLALPDGTAFDVLAAVRACAPAPVVLAMSGTATPLDTFELARAGVRAFVPKPLTLDGVERALREALATAPDVTPVIQAQVGHVPIHGVEERVRKVMVDEALARTGGNRRQAARMLSISRQLLQHILRRGDDDEQR